MPSQVNYLGHWRLVHDLVSGQLALAAAKAGKVKAGQPSCTIEQPPMRVIWLSSMTHIGARLDFSDLQLSKGYSGFLGYANSKLAAILAAKEFQRRLDRCGGHCIPSRADADESWIPEIPQWLTTWLCRSSAAQRRVTCCAVHPGGSVAAHLCPGRLLPMAVLQGRKQCRLLYVSPCQIPTMCTMFDGIWHPCRVCGH